jgi:hypothetical protein
MNTLRRRNIANELISKTTDALVMPGAYKVLYTSTRRQDFITKRRELRREAKAVYLKEKNLEIMPASPNCSQNYECLTAYGGPLIVPSAFDYRYYYGADLLDLIEDGFYDDYDPFENLMITKKFA